MTKEGTLHEVGQKHARKVLEATKRGEYFVGGAWFGGGKSESIFVVYQWPPRGPFRGVLHRTKWYDGHDRIPSLYFSVSPGKKKCRFHDKMPPC